MQTPRGPAWRRRMLVGATWAGVVAGGLVPKAAMAQPTRTSVRTTSTLRPPLSNACAALMNAPSELVRTPEGVALFRFKRELEGLATVFESRVPLEASEARRMSAVQRGVDSLLEVFVRSRSADGTLGPKMKLPRSDSTVITMRGRPLDGMASVEIVGSTAAGGQRNFELNIRALEPQIAAMASAGARIVKSGSTAGYLGVSLSGSQMRIVTDTGVFIAHCEYPMIEAVDVGSPARAAGLTTGDTVLAYNGRDLIAQTVNYPQMLIPGKVVRIRVRRDGKQRELPVTVRERTALGDESPGVNNVRVFLTNPSRGALPVPAERTGSFEMFFRDGSTFTGSSSGSGFSSSPNIVLGGSGTSSLFGAQLVAVDDELAQILTLEPGVLVTRVQPGSPAAEVGLRVGEMIRAVNGVPVRELAPLLRIVNASGAREVKLTVWGRETPVRIVKLPSRE
jgi:serine protease Do